MNHVQSHRRYAYNSVTQQVVPYAKLLPEHTNTEKLRRKRRADSFISPTRICGLPDISADQFCTSTIAFVNRSSPRGMAFPRQSLMNVNRRPPVISENFWAGKTVLAQQRAPTSTAGAGFSSPFSSVRVAGAIRTGYVFSQILETNR